MNEVHPYNDYSSIPKGTRLLIIGTAPPKRFSKPRPENWRPPFEEDVDFYYGSKDNLLWSNIFPELYREFFPIGDRPTHDKRRLFLKSQNIWMHDICEEYTRDGSDALDKGLVHRKLTDLRRILEEHETIKIFAFTGGTAEKLSGKRLEEQGLIGRYKFGEGGISKAQLPRQRSLSIAVNGGERKIQTFTVPSPSPRNLAGYELTEIIDRYRTALGSQLG